MTKPFAAFDADGTIFEPSLVEKAVEGYIAAKVFGAEPFNEAFANRHRWGVHNNEGVYQAYLDCLIDMFTAQVAGVEVQRLAEVTETMVADRPVPKFVFPRNLINAIQGSHNVIAFSDFPTTLVQPFLADLPIQSTFGSALEVEDDRFTGSATQAEDKVTVLKGLVAADVVGQAGSIAMGSTFNAIPMLNYSNTAVMFNADRTFKGYGSVFRWPSVNEADDRITVHVSDGQTGFYVEQDAGLFTERLRGGL